jgi:hypothetical protein
MVAVLPMGGSVQHKPDARVDSMASVHSEPLSQRLAAIREQLKLLSDYL